MMAPKIGVNLRVTGHCNQGGRKYMEDAFVVAYQQTEDKKDLEYAYFGIFDGHGGREAALFAKENLMDFVVNQKNFWSDNDELVLKAIRDGFIATHHAMWKEVGKWPKTVSGLPSTSGTTASIAFIRRGKMYIGHVGDSKIVLGYQDSESDMWMPQSLTKDHKPESPAEKERIYSVGGLVMNKAGVERVVWNRPRIGHKGPIRRSTHFDQIPFLAVARSLGDLWSYNYLQGEFVVSPEPDVCVITLDPKRDRCVILASDGLWNMVTLWNAVQLVQKAEQENEQIILESGHSSVSSKPANNPSKLLVDRALNRWYEFKMRADNTSVVTVLLDPPGPPKSEVLLRQKVMQKLRPRDDQSEGEVPIGNSPENLFRHKVIQKIRRDDQCDVPVSASPSDQEQPGIKSSEENCISGVLKEKKKLGNVLYSPRSSFLPKPVVLSPRRVVVKRAMSRESQSSPSSAQHYHTKLSERISPSYSHGKIPLNDSSHHSSDPPLNYLDQEAISKEKVLKIPDIGSCYSSCDCCNSGISKNAEVQETKDDRSLNFHRHNSCCEANSSKVLRNSQCSGDSESLEPSPKEFPKPNTLSTEENPNLEPDLSDTRTAGSSSIGDIENKESRRFWKSASYQKIRDSSPVLGIKRKITLEDGDSYVPLKHVRQQARVGSWTTEALPNCRLVASRDLALTHCTRARHRIRKMKA